MGYICQNLGMNFLDVGIGLFLVVGLFQGLKNGFFVEVASLIALVAGIYGAIHFSYVAGEYLAQQVDWSERNITIIAFAATLFAIVLLVHLMGRLLTAVVHFVLLGFLNKIAGGIFGMLRIAVVLGALFAFFTRFGPSLSFISEETKEESLLYEPLHEVGVLLFAYIPELEAEVTVENPVTEEG